MEKYITCSKFTDGDKFEVMVSISNEAHGITWYVTENTDSKMSEGQIIEKETTPICCLHSEEIKKNYEGKWLCCDYTINGRFCHRVSLYLTSDTLTIIRKNQFDIVDFFDASNGYPQHEGEYKYRYKNGLEA